MWVSAPSSVFSTRRTTSQTPGCYRFDEATRELTFDIEGEAEFTRCDGCTRSAMPPSEARLYPLISGELPGSAGVKTIPVVALLSAKDTGADGVGPSPSSRSELAKQLRGALGPTGPGFCFVRVPKSLELATEATFELMQQGLGRTP